MSVEIQVNILLKSWETLQMLSKSNSESAWNLRAWGLSLWSALIAYAYTSHTPQLITISIFGLFCLATNEIAQTGLSSLPPVIYYSEQLFSWR